LRYPFIGRISDEEDIDTDVDNDEGGGRMWLGESDNGKRGGKGTGRKRGAV
jgi:hypothetical protein